MVDILPGRYSSIRSRIHLTDWSFGVVVRADSPWKASQTPGTGSSLLSHGRNEKNAVRDGVKWLLVPYKGNAVLDAASPSSPGS